MGQGTSKPDKVIQELPETERYFGFENFGNTCYCNSVLQALYFCVPFRQKVLEYAATMHNRSDNRDTILSCLAELFSLVRSLSLFNVHRSTINCHMLLLQITAQKKKSGFISPRKFVNKVRSENELFSAFMHQDAHEFFNFLLNDISETLAKESKNTPPTPPPLSLLPPASDGRLHIRTPSIQALQEIQKQASFSSRTSNFDSDRNNSTNTSAPGQQALSPKTWVDDLFQGKLVNETRCLCCERVSSREEPFYDLSLEIEQNCSVSACLKQFSSTETLGGSDKFSCDACGCKQEAQKRMRIASLPPVLCLHLKRFKYVESQGQMKKLMHRVVFPFSLKVVNTLDECPDADAEYALSAVVVHMGAYINHGHYVALVKSAGRWLCVDDEVVHGVTESQVQSTFGHTQEPVIRPDGHVASSGHMDHGYILLYERVAHDDDVNSFDDSAMVLDDDVDDDNQPGDGMVLDDTRGGSHLMVR